MTEESLQTLDSLAYIAAFLILAVLILFFLFSLLVRKLNQNMPSRFPVPKYTTLPRKAPYKITRV